MSPFPTMNTDRVGGSGVGDAATADRITPEIAHRRGPPQTESTPNRSRDLRTEVDTLAALLIAACNGEPSAFDKLIAACRPLVERQARRDAWRAGDVDDIVQEVCIRLFEHARTIREPRSLLSWLAMVTKRSASQVGRCGVRLVPTALEDNRPSSTSTEEQVLHTHERRDVTDGVRAALDRLNAEDRRVLLLLEGDEQLSYRDVSGQVCRPVGSIGPTRQRLLRRLRLDPAVRRLRPAS